MPSMDVHFSSNNMNLCTPPEVLEAVRRMGPIGLDPATNGSNPTGARAFYNPPSYNGLELPWYCGEGEVVYFNPPYGRQIGQWTQKAYQSANLRRHFGLEILGLVPARTDTRWFQSSGADAWCAWRGRLHFIDPETNEPVKCWSKKHEKWVDAKAPFPSAVLYYGRDVEKFVAYFHDKGNIYVRSI